MTHFLGGHKRRGAPMTGRHTQVGWKQDFESPETAPRIENICVTGGGE